MAATPYNLSISPILETRDGTSASKDARVTNMFVELSEQKILNFVKRPGYQYLTGTAWTTGAFGATLLPTGTILAITGTGTASGNATLNTY